MQRYLLPVMALLLLAVPLTTPDYTWAAEEPAAVTVESDSTPAPVTEDSDTAPVSLTDVVSSDEAGAALAEILAVVQNDSTSWTDKVLAVLLVVAGVALPFVLRRWVIPWINVKIDESRARAQAAILEGDANMTAEKRVLIAALIDYLGNAAKDVVDDDLLRLLEGIRSKEDWGVIWDRLKSDLRQSAIDAFKESDGVDLLQVIGKERLNRYVARTLREALPLPDGGKDVAGTLLDVVVPLASQFGTKWLRDRFAMGASVDEVAGKLGSMTEDQPDDPGSSGSED